MENAQVVGEWAVMVLYRGFIFLMLGYLFLKGLVWLLDRIFETREEDEEVSN